MQRLGFTLQPTPAQAREQERAAQRALAAHLNALATKPKEAGRG